MDCILPPAPPTCAPSHPAPFKFFSLRFIFLSQKKKNLVGTIEQRELYSNFSFLQNFWWFVQSFYMVVKYAHAPNLKQIVLDVLVMILVIQGYNANSGH